jgi:hypothetical protein
LGQKYRDYGFVLVSQKFLLAKLSLEEDVMDETNKSEVARIKQQIAIEYQAASRVFTEFNAKARHAYLTARQEKLGACLEELTLHMSPEDAMQIFIQAQAEIAQKLTNDQKTEALSDKLLADQPSADTTNFYDETGRSSSDMTS